MLLKLFGCFWIIANTYFFIKPRWLKERLKKTPRKELKQKITWLILAVSIVLLQGAWGRPGIFYALIFISGMIGLAKAFFFYKARSADQVVSWFIDHPPKFFRNLACMQVVVGIVIVIA